MTDKTKPIQKPKVHVTFEPEDYGLLCSVASAFRMEPAQFIRTEIMKIVVQATTKTQK